MEGWAAATAVVGRRQAEEAATEIGHPQVAEEAEVLAELAAEAEEAVVAVTVAEKAGLVGWRGRRSAWCRRRVGSCTR
jgi:hypothetical protein